MTDVILNANFDLTIDPNTGDFVVDDCENQIQQLLLIAQPGNFRESPITGVGIANYIKTQFSPALVESLKKQIQLQWLLDGYAGVNVVVNSFTDIQIVANR